MKDLRLPIMSREEEQKAWDSLKPNDKLVRIERTGWGDDYYIRYYTIVKKTPKGSLRLDNGELLKCFYSSYYILNDELKGCIRKIELEKSVIRLIFEVDRNKKDFKSNLTYEDAIKLKEILERVINK